MMLKIIAVFCGGGLGACLRWMVTQKICAHWGTLFVNVLGAFLIGVLYQCVVTHSGLRPDMKLFLMTGLLGGFTTFSTYILDFAGLVQSGRMSVAFLYLFASVCIGIVGFFAGVRIVSVFG